MALFSTVLEAIFIPVAALGGGIILILMILHYKRIKDKGGNIKYTGWLISDISRASDEILDEEFQEARFRLYEVPCLLILVLIAIMFLLLLLVSHLA